jgi:hypothetical protein
VIRKARSDTPKVNSRNVEGSGTEIGDVPLIVKPDDGLLGKYTTAGMG